MAPAFSLFDWHDFERLQAEHPPSVVFPLSLESLFLCFELQSANASGLPINLCALSVGKVLRAVS